jgi:hypothetical protein
MTLRRRSIVEAALLLLLGAQGLHHLRFLIAPAHDSGATLHEHGHGVAHLLATGPAIGLLLALLLALLVVRAAGVPRRPSSSSVRIRRIWPLAAAALLLIYGSQELAEGVLGHGHEGGFSALLEDGGWVALPIAIALGGLIALAVRVGRAADALVFAPHVAIELRLAAPISTLVRAAVARPPRALVSLLGAGRGPPVMA